MVGFEEILKKVDSEEKNVLIPSVRDILIKHHGKANAITNDEIAEILKRQGHNCAPARIRKMINYIRVKGIVYLLAASSKGYYIVKTQEEFDNYVKSLLQRELAIKAVRKSLENQFITMQDNDD